MSIFIQDLLLPTIVLVTLIFFVLIIPFTREAYFKSIPSVFNKVFRGIDDYINGRDSFDQVGWFNSAGHSRTLSIVVFIVLLFTLFGPTLFPVVGWLSWENLSAVQIAWGAGTWLLFFVLLTALGYFSKRCSGNSLRWVHAAVIFVAAVFILYVVPETYYEALGLPYRHAVAVISAALLVVGLIPARFIRFVSFRDFFSDDDEAFNRRALARCLLEKNTFYRFGT